MLHTGISRSAIYVLSHVFSHELKHRSVVDSAHSHSGIKVYLQFYCNKVIFACLYFHINFLVYLGFVKIKSSQKNSIHVATFLSILSTITLWTVFHITFPSSARFVQVYNFLSKSIIKKLPKVITVHCLLIQIPSLQLQYK